MFMFTNLYTYLLVLESTKIYLKFTLKCFYIFRSMTIIRSSYLSLAKVTIVKNSLKNKSL